MHHRQSNSTGQTEGIRQHKIGHSPSASIQSYRKGNDDGTDVVVLNECCEWMSEPIVGHLQKPEEAPVLFVDFDPVTAWIAVLPMKELVVWIEGMDSGVMVTEGAIAVPDSVRHGAGGVWWGL